MLTIEKLNNFGANTEEGLGRCYGNEALYLRLVGMIPAEASFDKLQSAIESNDLDAAFEAAHALKGITANVALTPLCEPVSELTEILRPAAGSMEGREEECQAYLERITQQRDELISRRDGN